MDVFQKCRGKAALILSFLIIIGSNLLAGDLSLSAVVSQSAIPFESQDTLKVVLRWSGGADDFTMDRLPEPGLEKLKVLGSASSVSSRPDSSVQGGDITTRVFTYILEPTDYGVGVINPIQLQVTNSQTGEIHNLQTGRIEVQIDRPRPPAEQKSSSMLLIGGSILASLIIIAFIFWFIKVKTKPKDVVVSGYTAYLEQLEEIKRECVADGKQFFARTYRMLLTFLQKEWGYELSGMTGEQVLNQLEQMEDRENKIKINGWLKQAIEIKYRPVKPTPGEVEDYYRTVKSFFEDNK